MGQLDEMLYQWLDGPNVCPATRISASLMSKAKSLMMGINDVAVSAGRPARRRAWSRVMCSRRLGAGDELAHSSIRFGLGRFNTEAEVDYVAERVVETVQPPAGALAALRDGERRRGPETVQWVVTHVSLTLTLEDRNHMAYSDKVLDHYNNPRNVGSSTRTSRTSAPAWSARRSAATS